MALPLYLAMTTAEINYSGALPPALGYMACHFSPCGKGLSNLPERLPEGAMLILDDSTPICGHDHRLITNQLTEQVTLHRCGSVLLDFERADSTELRDLTTMLCEVLPCPVSVSELYARGIPCPVFLPPVPPDRPLKEHLAPWSDREIWLEAALNGIALTLRSQGCTADPLFAFPEEGTRESKLHCHYTIETDQQSARFRLWRTRKDLDSLLKEAENVGVTRAIGLWQELER